VPSLELVRTVSDELRRAPCDALGELPDAGAAEPYARWLLAGARDARADSGRALGRGYVLARPRPGVVGRRYRRARGPLVTAVLVLGVLLFGFVMLFAGFLLGAVLTSRQYDRALERRDHGRPWAGGE